MAQALGRGASGTDSTNSNTGGGVVGEAEADPLTQRGKMRSLLSCACLHYCDILHYSAVLTFSYFSSLHIAVLFAFVLEITRKIPPYGHH